MVRKSIALSAVGAALTLLLSTAPAHAQTYSKLTYLTFSGPVRIPGVTLLAGTYRFMLADPATSARVIQVLSRDGSTAYGMFHTLPDVRQTATDESSVTFKETRAGTPPAIRSFFYAGEHNGYEFMYSKAKPIVVGQR